MTFITLTVAVGIAAGPPEHLIKDKATPRPFGRR